MVQRQRQGRVGGDKPAYVDYYKFLDPARPEVREFVRDTVRELAAIPGLTGIHLDYIRHPDAILPSGLWSKYGIVQDKVYPAYDYGYTDYSRRAFKAKTGIDPIELKDPESDAAWMKYRLDSVVDLVNDYLVPAAHAGGKKISAAVFPGPSRARVMVRQDWGRFKLDAFMPMLYHTFYDAGPEFVKTYTEEAVRTVTQPIYSGLFVAAARRGGVHDHGAHGARWRRGGRLDLRCRRHDARTLGAASESPRRQMTMRAAVAIVAIMMSWAGWTRSARIDTPKHYIAHRAATSLVIDGRLNDAAWRDAAWTDPFVDIEGDSKPRPRFDTRVKMLWDDQYFYVGADLEEPHVWATLTAHDSVIFHDPDFEIFIDPNGDALEYYEFEINALGTFWDLFLPKPY